MAHTWETHPSFAPIFWLMLVLCAHHGCSGAPGHWGCLELGPCKGNHCEHRTQGPVSLSFHFFRINSQECGSGWMLSICFIFKETGRVIFRAAVPSHIPCPRKSATQFPALCSACRQMLLASYCTFNLHFPGDERLFVILVTTHTSST